ncbi:hypothetical protein [uncultured Amnibacterium sp.]
MALDHDHLLALLKELQLTETTDQICALRSGLSKNSSTRKRLATPR